MCLKMNVSKIYWMKNSKLQNDTDYAIYIEKTCMQKILYILYMCVFLMQWHTNLKVSLDGGRGIRIWNNGH